MTIPEIKKKLPDGKKVYKEWATGANAQNPDAVEGAKPGDRQRFESIQQKGLFFWVEPVEISEGWMVVSQVDGYPATEAYDDWFRYEKDAIEVAELLARGEL